MLKYLLYYFAKRCRKNENLSKEMSSDTKEVLLDAKDEQHQFLVYQSNAQIRDTCWKEIENMEHWARRLIHEIFLENYGSEYFDYVDSTNKHIIKNTIVKDIKRRMEDDPWRYPRAVDALTLVQIIFILCNNELYEKHFKVVLLSEYPCGIEHVKCCLTKIKDARNRYAHNNNLPIRDAERVICYCHDFIEGLRKYYQEIGVGKDYNVPTFIKLCDSHGFVQYFAANQSRLISRNSKDFKLRSGEVYRIEVEVDPMFSQDDYDVYWRYGNNIENGDPEIKGHVIDIPITNDNVGRTLQIDCRIVTKKSWHGRGNCDDYFYYEIASILPPIEDSY